MSTNTIESMAVSKSEVMNRVSKKVRLRILLWIYSEGQVICNIDNEEAKIELAGYKASSCNVIYTDTTPNDPDTEVVDLNLRISEKKESFKKAERLLRRILQAYSLIYKSIILDIIIPSDTEFTTSIYHALAIIVKEDYPKKFPKLDIKNSRVFIMMPAESEEQESVLDKNLPSDLDAKMAAIMSHYVYFYTDWLEYVLFHEKELGRYQRNKKSVENEFQHLLINEGNIFTTGISSVGSEKVKLRIINRLKEIAKITKKTSNHREGIVKETLVIIENSVHSIIKNKNKGDANKKELIEREKQIKNSEFNIHKAFLRFQKETKITSAQYLVEKRIDGVLKKIKAKCDKTDKTNKTNNKANSKGNNADSLSKDDTLITDQERKVNAQFASILDELGSMNIILDILKKCKLNGKPLDLYELYDEFEYWNNVKSVPGLVDEARKWHVSHPFEVLKLKEANFSKGRIKDRLREQNVCIVYQGENIVYHNNSKNARNDDQEEIKIFPYSKGSSEKIEVYNTIFTHGMDQFSGYGAELFTKIENGMPTAYAYCTKGTDVNSFNDWVLEDLLQGVCGIAPQYIHNLKNAITIDRKVGSNTKLFFCGHSLGGGLASAGAIASTGRHAITFNAAGLNLIGSTLTKGTNLLYGNSRAFKHPYHRVHPIRIDGEIVDAVMIGSKVFLGGLNERGYGSDPLIIKLNPRVKIIDLSESPSKHGINNFLNESILNQISIVKKRTIVQTKIEGVEKILLSDLADTKIEFKTIAKGFIDFSISNKNVKNTID